MAKKITHRVLQGNKPGDYAGNDGLVLRIRSTAKGSSKSWLFKKSVDGQPYLLTIGALSVYGWDRAQDIATQTFQNILDGTDGKTALQHAISPPQKTTQHDYTFKAILDAKVRLKYSNIESKDAKAWRASLDRLIVPDWGDWLVWELTWAQLGEVFLDYYRKCPGEGNMAIKTIERFAQCMDHARMLEPDNPHGIDAQMWRDRRKWLLDNGLPNDAVPQKDDAMKGNPAMSYQDIASVWPQYKPEQVSDLILQLQSLTLTRVGSLQKATWDEFDWEAQEWCIPAAHLKVKDRGDFTIPLTDIAMDVLHRLHDINGNVDHVMTNPKGRGFVLSSQALNQRLDHMKVKAICGRNPVNHGFRSTFREWADDKLEGLDNEVEWCLHHKFWNKVNDAYRKKPKSRLFLAKRRIILAQWADWVTGKDPEATRIIPDGTGVVSFAQRFKTRG